MVPLSRKIITEGTNGAMWYNLNLNKLCGFEYSLSNTKRRTIHLIFLLTVPVLGDFENWADLGNVYQW